MAKTVSSSMYKAAKTARDIKILASGEPEKSIEQASLAVAFEAKDMEVSAAFQTSSHPPQAASPTHCNP